MSKTVEEVRRAAFEAWAPYRTDLNKDGFYASSHTRAQWSAFNAALDLVCIEIPALNNSHIGGPDSEMGPSIEQVEDAGYDYAVKDCRAAIEQTGLGLRVL